MSDSLLQSQASTASSSGLLAKRAGIKKDKAAARRAFWRMIGLCWTHRRAMTWGVLLGVGVALTYAASLGGLLPVLKVITSDQSLHQSMIEAAEKHSKWYSPYLVWLAPIFPAGNAPAA